MQSFPRGIWAAPRGVWTLGFVSLFMDVSSEMIHSLLPLFLVATLGVGVGVVGLMEGAAEATAAIVRMFSGWLSDRLGHRKWLAVAGYGLSAITKVAFPLATSPLTVFAARFTDRVGKGVRGAPRDALVADITPPALRGAAFGLRQALDTVGALLGPLLAMGLMALLAGNIRAVYAFAFIPAAVAVLLLVAGVEEPRAAAAPAARPRPAPILWSEVRGMGAAFWAVAAVGVVFTLARFSEAFLVLRARDAGLSLALAPGVMVVMNLAYALVSAPAGSLSDRMDRRILLAAGLAVLILADGVLAAMPTLAGLAAGAALWGAHMGLTQGVLAALVADSAPARLRGTAFGLFSLVTGVALLIASALAGVLWSLYGGGATFATGGAFAALALAGLGALIRWRGREIPADREPGPPSGSR